MTTPLGGIGSVLAGLGRADLDGRPAPPERDPTPRTTTDGHAASAALPDTAEAVGDGPESSGVDPDLWRLLSADERVFYARNALTGPITYGPGESQEASASPRSRLGGRIDVRG